MTPEVRFAAAALGCFALVALLGAYVSSRTPLRLDVEAIALRGVAVPLAATFTLLGRWYSVTLILALGFFIAVTLRVDVLPLVAVAIAQMGSQAMAALFKRTFHRVRPDHWLLWQEADRSYPSGHATTGIAFYLALFMLVLDAHVVPRPIWIGALIGLGGCSVGVPWSRLALGAHYLSDVAGGLLLGAGWLFVLLALATGRGFPL
jgi:membrane-associated phospholipid phosphatase